MVPSYPSWARRFSTTGGSTGEPLRIVKNLGSIAIAEAALLRGRLWAGIGPGDRTVKVKSMERPSWAGRLRGGILNMRMVDAYDGEDQSASQALEVIRRFRPRYLTGYPTSLLRLAEMAGDHGPKVPVIFSTGEMLYPAQRDILAQVFQARVSDHYGCNEINSVAFECEHGVKHIVEEHVVVESVDESGQAVWEEPGRLLLTDLDNYAMPLIRYEVGDMGILSREPCLCGRPFTVLKSVEGRMQDALRTSDGKSLPAIFFASRFRNMRAVKAYQLIQTDWKAADLHYVASDSASAQDEVEAIRQEIWRRFGTDFRVQPLACKEVALTPRGKSRLVVGLTRESAGPAVAAGVAVGGK